MKETQVHLDAFKLYYSMKASRSYEKIAEQIGVSERNVSKWGKNFKWQKRISEIEQKIATEVEKKLIEEEVETRVNFNNAINESIDIYRNMITGKDSINEDITKILGSLVSSYCKLEVIKGQVETVTSQVETVNEDINATIFNLNFYKDKKPEDYGEGNYEVEDGDDFEEETAEEIE